MRNIYRCAALGLLSAINLFIGACQVIGGDDVGGTLEAANSIYEAEVAQLSVDNIISQTEVAVTLSAAETRAAQVLSMNQQLFATLDAGSTPTPALVVGQADAAALGADTMFEEGDRLFIKTGVTENVDSDGCVVNPTTTFTPDTPQIYATMQVFNVEAGTPLRAEWYFQEELRIADDWTVDIYSHERCLWFVLESSRTEFTPGSWRVILYADEENFQLEDPITFFITEG